MKLQLIVIWGGLNPATTNWSQVEQNLKSFIAKMQHYPAHGVASKNTLEEVEYFPIDSARFYLENSICYQHARPMQDDNNPIFYDFTIGYYTRYTNKMTMDDVNSVYERVKDSLANYFETIEAGEKQLTDLMVQFQYSGTGVEFNIHSTFGILTNGNPSFRDPSSITFYNYFSDYPLWHWENYEQKLPTVPPTIVPIAKRALDQLKIFYWQRQQLTIMPPYSVSYLWVKNPTPYGLSQTPIFAGLPQPSPADYFTAPTGFPPISTNIQNTFYFLAGSNDFTTDLVDEKTWLTSTMLDFYLVKTIIYANNHSPYSGYVPWQMTVISGSNATFAFEYSNANINWLNLKWRKWITGTYYAYKTPITLPAPIPL